MSKFYYGAYQFGETEKGEPAFILKVSDEVDSLNCETISKTIGCFDVNSTPLAMHRLKKAVRDLSSKVSPITHLEFDMSHCYKVFEVFPKGNDFIFEQETIKQVGVR